MTQNISDNFQENILNEALEAHRKGDIAVALSEYEKYLSVSPKNPIALYGFASIKLAKGDISVYPKAIDAFFNGQPSTLDKPLASESIIRTLISQQYQDHAKQFLDECEVNGVIPNKFDELKKLVEIPSYLEHSVYDPLLEKELERYRPIESSNFVYAIDIVGGCNLRCPTCPVSSGELSKGLMSIDLYKKILTKIRAESKDENPDIWLFSWTEPFLNPNISEFIKVTNEFGFTSFLSTNLNLGARLEEVMMENPTRIKISLSSLQQDIYCQTHARGNIETVIENLHKLSEYRIKHKATTKIWIGHHLYRNTIDHQAEVKQLADKLGFGYAPSVAIVAPIERVMKMKPVGTEDNVDGLREQLLYDPLDLQKVNAKKRSGKKDCELRFNMTTIQYDGSVNLCCGTTQTISNEPIYFLDHNHQELEDMKYKNLFCKKCIQSNLHLTIPDC